MKITSHENIAQSEKDFIDTINAELDWEVIEKLLLEKHKITLQEEIDYKDGDLIVHNNNIAYKFNFEIKVPLSLIFNRDGQCLELSTLRDDLKETENNLEENNLEENLEENNLEENNLKENLLGDDKTGELASNLSDIISEINQDDDE